MVWLVDGLMVRVSVGQTVAIVSVEKNWVIVVGAPLTVTVVVCSTTRGEEAVVPVDCGTRGRHLRITMDSRPFFSEF